MTESPPPDERPRGLHALFREARRRRVVRAAIAYVAGAFVTLEGAEIILPVLGAPDRFLRFLVIGAILGLPVTIVLSWIFELTPEGLRMTGRGSEEGEMVARGRTLLLYGGGGFLALLAVVLAFLWARPRLVSGEVAAGADVIAVLPFNASGPRVEVMGEGMADLLSRNLNEVGAIRTVDSRTILYRWSQRAVNGRLLPEEQLELGRAVEAGSILTGSVVQAGSSVRLTADLIGVDGTELASAAVDGPAEGILALVDSLSVELLREIWRSNRLPPTLQVSAITSGDLEAIRAFLEGERHYRASWWDAAIAAFRRAVEADSTFALAHYRLASAAGWGGTAPGRDTVEARAAERAARFSDRLPERERLLVRALAARTREGRSASIPILEGAVGRYPDDPEAWWHYADDRFHLEFERMGPERPPLGRRLELFDRVIELDPSFVPAYIHPLELAFQEADTTRIEGYLRRLEDRSLRDPFPLRIYRAGLEATRSPDDLGRLMPALALAMEGAETGAGNLGWQATRAVTPSLLRLALGLPAADRRRVEAWLASRAGKRGREPTAAEIGHRLVLLAGGGELRRMRALLEEPATASTLEKDPAGLRLGVGLLGYAEPAGVPDGVPVDAGGLRALVDLLHAYDRGDLRGVDEATERFEERGREADGKGWKDAVAGAGRGLAEVLEGDTAAGLSLVERSLSGVPFGAGLLSEPLWFRWAGVLALHPETRERGSAILARPWPGRPIYEPLRIFHLARAREAAGDRERAAALYRRFAEIMADADPGLLVAEEVAEARRKAAPSPQGRAAAVAELPFVALEEGHRKGLRADGTAGGDPEVSGTGGDQAESDEGPAVAPEPEEDDPGGVEADGDEGDAHEEGEEDEGDEEDPPPPELP